MNNRRFNEYLRDFDQPADLVSQVLAGSHWRQVVRVMVPWQAGFPRADRRGQERCLDRRFQVSAGHARGQLLRQLRISAGLSQEELAQAAQLSTRTVSDLERGINLTARSQTARLLADALGLTGQDEAGFLAAAVTCPPGQSRRPMRCRATSPRLLGGPARPPRAAST
jgi:DNA-binding XRE family transcriptional regulator